MLFRAKVPEKLIGAVTWKRSNGLQLYEHLTLQQKQSVSQVLVQGKDKFSDHEKENHGPVPEYHASVVPTQLQQPSSSVAFKSFFTGLSNCSLVVKVGTLPTTCACFRSSVANQYK